MNKAKQIITANKYLILLSIVTIIALLIENLTAIIGIKGRVTLESVYGGLQIAMMIIYALFFIIFSLTVKKRKSYEFCVVLLLLIMTWIAYMYFQTYTFVGSSPSYIFQELVYKNPFVFHFKYSEVSVLGEITDRIITNKVISVTPIAVIISIVTTGISIIKSAAVSKNLFI